MTKLVELTNDTNIYTETMLHLCSDEKTFEEAKRFGVENWKEIGLKGRQAYDWCFGRESRLPSYMTISANEHKSLTKAEDRIFDRQEQSGMYD